MQWLPHGTTVSAQRGWRRRGSNLSFGPMLQPIRHVPSLRPFSAALSEQLVGLVTYLLWASGLLRTAAAQPQTHVDPVLVFWRLTLFKLKVIFE